MGYLRDVAIRTCRDGSQKMAISLQGLAKDGYLTVKDGYLTVKQGKQPGFALSLVTMRKSSCVRMRWPSFVSNICVDHLLEFVRCVIVREVYWLTQGRVRD